MKKYLNISLFILVLTVLMALAVSCSLSVSNDDTESTADIKIQRYDSLQYLFLQTGDYSALQQMKTKYPNETRTLIENVLKLGSASKGNASERMLKFFQDSTLQRLLVDVSTQYSDMSEVNSNLTRSFQRLQKRMPHIGIPKFYAQVSAFSESIVVGNDNTVGISLDKYMGKDYEIYNRFYSEEQRETMTRDNIVPDCLTFYLMSLYQLPDFEKSTQQERDEHVACIQWIVNYAMDKHFFSHENINKVDEFMKKNPQTTFDQLLDKGVR